MRHTVVLFATILLLSAPSAFAQNCGPWSFPDWNTADSSAADAWSEDLFKLNQSYPASAPSGAMPWDAINYKKDPAKFMNSVLTYFLSGNEPAGFYAHKNTASKWYHAPWLHFGAGGSDFVHGLKIERSSQPEELHPEQTAKFRNYSVSYFNEAGGYTLGQVWCKPDAPDPAKASFPVGTVWVRLVFTTADTAQVPFLVNSPFWDAYLDLAAEPPYGKKTTGTVRLIQMDFGVKTKPGDPKSNGWVFGTYVYNGFSSDTTLAGRMMPLGLQWGNDPMLNDSAFKAGAKPTETWINSAALRKDFGGEALVQHLGKHGRLAGPVDDSTSSLYSAHSTAVWPSVPVQADGATSMKYFRNLTPGEAWTEKGTSLDFSLDLALGIYNFYQSTNENQGVVAFRGSLTEYEELTAPPGEEELVIPSEEPNGGLAGARKTKFFVFLILILGMVGLLLYSIFSRPKVS